MKYTFATCPDLNYLCSSLTCYLHFRFLSTIDLWFPSFCRHFMNKNEKFNSLSCHNILKDAWRMAFVASLHLKTRGLLLVTDQSESQEDPLHICGSGPCCPRLQAGTFCTFDVVLSGWDGEHKKNFHEDAGHPDSQTFRVLWSALSTTTCCKTYPETIFTSILRDIHCVPWQRFYIAPACLQNRLKPRN